MRKHAAKQKQTLNWMRAEINKNHLQAKVLKPVTRERGGRERQKIHVALSNIQQDGQTLTFNIDRVNVYELKNWLREVNLTTGVRLEKMDLTPVDHLSDVKAQIKLSGESGMNSLTLLQGSQMPALCLLSGTLGGIIGSFLGVVVEHSPLIKGGGAGNLLFPTSHCPACSHTLAGGKISRF